MMNKVGPDQRGRNAKTGDVFGGHEFCPFTSFPSTEPPGSLPLSRLAIVSSLSYLTGLLRLVVEADCAEYCQKWLSA